MKFARCLRSTCTQSLLMAPNLYLVDDSKMFTSIVWGLCPRPVGTPTSSCVQGYTLVSIGFPRPCGRVGGQTLLCGPCSHTEQWNIPRANPSCLLRKDRCYVPTQSPLQLVPSCTIQPTRKWAEPTRSPPRRF